MLEQNGLKSLTITMWIIKLLLGYREIENKLILP
jgi:hypothetical protein